MRIRWRNLELPTRVIGEHVTPNYGRFVVEPFERGFGVTVGNSIRRILLSSLEGTAVTSLRIVGVEHEYQALPGVYEDVTDIILNVKGLLVKMEGDEPATITLKKSGKGPVTGADIQTDHRTQVVNPDVHICELVEDRSIEMTFTVSRGRGYVTADENAGESREIGLIPIDSPFSPVQRVRYDTENTRVGKITNYDKLSLEIWTNGTVSPEMALVEASKILRKHLNPFVQYFEHGRELGEQSTAIAASASEAPVATSVAADSNGAAASTGGGGGDDMQALLAKPITDLGFSQRASNCLSSENIQTIGDLVRRKESDLLKVRNFGKTTLKEITDKLSKHDLTLDMDV